MLTGRGPARGVTTTTLMDWHTRHGTTGSHNQHFDRTTATAARRGGDELRSRHVRTAPTPGPPAPGRGGQAPGGHPRCGDRGVRRQGVRRGDDPVSYTHL